MCLDQGVAHYCWCGLIKITVVVPFFNYRYIAWSIFVFYKPLAQAFVITKRAKDSTLARRFAAYFQTSEAHKIMERYGFVLPKK
ncbi:MAG: extracellular solute-binding protein [Candidatus Nitrotoga sp. SPKER]|nr:MAG: extracellular solute-binding protein [Candidatus Nitrotoga sp. SPKER]